MVLDVETAGNIGKPMVYDLGFAVADKKGNIYAKRSFVISEIFDNEPLMAKAYYAEKVPQYKADIESGKRIKVTFAQARQSFIELMEQFQINTIAAYNLSFDKRALKATTEKIFGEGVNFMPTEMEEVNQLCLWSFACEVIYTQPSFWKIAETQAWFTPAGNMRTSAEIGHRYITGDFHFEESHTGLEDVEIEIQIMAKCFAQHKQHDSGIISHPWRIPNSARNNK